MSFLNKIKELFGFGEYQQIDIPELPPINLPGNNANGVSSSTIVVADTAIEVSEEMMQNIFGRVVEVTNTAIPAYFKQAVDVERQKKFLYDALDSSVKEYLAALEEKSQAKCLAMWQKEREELRVQMETHKQRAAELETKRAELHDEKLSSDRQKRALSERVHDLESQVMRLEAEKEQYEIENRSLLNKAKVASVYEADNEAMKEELDILRKTASSSNAKEEMDKLMQEINYLKTENTKLSESCQAAKVKDQMSESMLNNLQKRASDSQQSVKELEKKIEQLESGIAVKNAHIDDLNNQIDEKDARLSENEQAFEEFEKIAAKLDAFENIKMKYEEKIQKYEEKIKKLSVEKDTPVKEAEPLTSPSIPENKPVDPQPKVNKDQIEKMKSDPIAGQDFMFDDFSL